jgi:hypothetical protein
MNVKSHSELLVQNHKPSTVQKPHTGQLDDSSSQTESGRMHLFVHTILHKESFFPYKGTTTGKKKEN